MSLPGSIGKVDCKVVLSSSPFNVIPKQEWGNFFSPDNFTRMSGPENTAERAPISDPSNIFPMPFPIAGYRLTEQMEVYDNFIMDQKGTWLEDAANVHPDASANYNQIKDEIVPGSLPGLSVASYPAMKNFFGWKVSDNVFKQHPPDSFEDKEAATSNSYQNEWTYRIKEVTGIKKAKILTPYMTSAPQNDKQPIHWGCQRVNPLQFNQPFEILYYHDGVVPNIPEGGTELNLSFDNTWRGGADETHGQQDDFGIKIDKKAYFIIRIGGIANDFSDYWFIFAQGLSPTLIGLVPAEANKMTEGVAFVGYPEYRIISQFREFVSDNLFGPNNDFFQFKIEPCRLGFLITVSTSTFSFPWIIQGTGKYPIFYGGIQNPGEAILSIYSGNVPCGFAFRPVQYAKSGIFRPPGQIIEVLNDTDMPICTAAMKGTGTNQQSVSTTTDGKDYVYALDAEIITEQGTVASTTKTVISNAIGVTIPSGGERKVEIAVEAFDAPPETEIQNSTVEAIKRKKYQATVTLTSSNVEFKDIIIPQGKSPYIWQIRFEYNPPDQSAEETVGLDISCDVLSVDLQWNATSAWEISHAGSIKVLNRPNSSGINYYEQYSNRSIYLKIHAGWECGEGLPIQTIFTGMTVGATLDKQAERDVVTFKIEDYMNALEGIKFVLCPYYDGMYAYKAVEDILKHAGFPIGTKAKIIPLDSVSPYGLPFVNAFEQPQFRFQDGTPLKEAVVKIAKLEGNMMFFNQYGNFYYGPIPGGYVFNQDIDPVASLYSSVKNAQKGSDLIWNIKSVTRNINEIYNSVLVSTTDREGGTIVHKGLNNDAAIKSPESPGYMGYRKQFIHRDSAIGSEASANLFLQTYYKRLCVPPRTGRFELFGRSDLAPIDTILVDDEKFRIVNISRQIDKENNNYFMNVEGEWFDVIK